MIDFAKIDFPSDKLTVKMMREATPPAFDVEPKDYGHDSRFTLKRHSLDYTLGSLIDSERVLAEMAFNRKLGLPDRQSTFTKDDMIENTLLMYIRYKLAFGEHDSLAMIQKIEKQAEAQARQFSGPGR